MKNDGKKIDRRSFVKKSLLGTAGTALLASCGGQDPVAANGDAPAVHTGKKIRWRLVSSFPRSLDTIFGSSEVLAERVAALSEGQFTIRIYPAGEIVPGLQVMDAVQQGTVQMGQTASYYFTGKNPALAFDTCFPFGLTARQQNAWLDEAGGRDLVNELFADFSIVTLPSGNTGMQMGGWFKHEIDTAEDLRGLTMRIPGIGGQVMSRLGATVQVLSGGDIYPALERGAIDATEWVGPYDDEKLGFHKIVKNYYYPGWWEPGPSLSFYVHREAWDSLPTVYQAILRVAARDAAQTMQTRYDAKNPAALVRLINEGVVLRPFSKEILTAARAESLAYLEELSSEDATFRRVFEPWKQFRQQSYSWFNTAELTYQAFAFPGMPDVPRAARSPADRL